MASLTCIICPVGCRINVEGKPGALEITGNRCPRGKRYAEQETTSPVRTITSTVRLVGAEDAVMLPVKTSRPVPKSEIGKCLAEIRKMTATVPVAIGDTIGLDVAGTGADVIASGNAPAPRKGERFRSHVLLGEGEFMVTSPFGERIHPVTGAVKFHAGVDGALWAGGQLVETGICACADGTVIDAHPEDDNDAGVHVVIDHGDGVVSQYFHLEPGTLKVRRGDHVSRRQLLGWMGMTGLSTGEHIHFQVEISGKPVDPMPFLRSDSV